MRWYQTRVTGTPFGSAWTSLELMKIRAVRRQAELTDPPLQSHAAIDQQMSTILPADPGSSGIRVSSLEPFRLKIETSETFGF
jgi:hypothetical protein